MQRTRWRIKNIPDEKSVLALADSLNISNSLAALLIQRGVTNFFEAKAYFRPSLDLLHDPYLMDGMAIASARVLKALTDNEKICVYGDYDVDGTCSAALMYLFLKELGADVFTYIPNRITEGYGISKMSIDIIKEKNTSLIISVDCGITAVEEIEYGNTLGIDTVVCDHHQAKDLLPPAYAILDPIKPGCNYPFKHLSGAGVAFKLARAVGARIGKKSLPLKYLDLVALAGAADIVPLLDENRTLVREGLDLINANPRPGILALLRSAKIEPGNLSAGQIVFTIAPRINAVGRLGDANRAVELFTTTDPQRAIELASVLEGENSARRKIDEKTFGEALKLVEDEHDLAADLGIVLHNNDWHPGVIGIVASRLVERYHRPSVMLTTIDGVAKGSARSIPGFNIYEALQACEHLLLQFGGHEAAAGLAVEIDKIDIFKTEFNIALKRNMTQKDVIPEISIDAKLVFSEITPKFFRILNQFSPFGPGNSKPVFLSEGVSLVYQPRIVGTNHLIASFRQNGGDKVFDSIGFNLGEFIEFIDKDRDLLDIVYTLETISKDGKHFPQLRLKDIRIHENNRN
ncbi:MAG: single-stranded-DNA-specific exonuclease RecJ [Melioribacteraceae bacterium]|nr:single-stranded-DNA-specific exonuclease RecJ [Melioribacteraceae bacterium]